MELTSAPLHKGQVSWRGLLLTASPTTAQVAVEAVPPHLAEEKKVLRVHNLPATVLLFYWYKGESVVGRNEIAGFIMSNSTSETGPAYSGREMIYPSGSLLTQNVTQKGAGAKVIYMLSENCDIRVAFVQFHVHRKQLYPLGGGCSSSYFFTYMVVSPGWLCVMVPTLWFKHLVKDTQWRKRQ